MRSLVLIVMAIQLSGRGIIALKTDVHEYAYGIQYPDLEDYGMLADLGINLVLNNVTKSETEWENVYRAVVSNDLTIIPVLWGDAQTAWEWNDTAEEWELNFRKYPDSVGAQFLQFLRDHPRYLDRTFAVYSFHEPLNPESPAQVSTSQMRKFWEQIHEDEFPGDELEIYGESVSRHPDCANGCVDYDTLGLYNFADCGLVEAYQYRVFTAVQGEDRLYTIPGACTADTDLAIRAGREYIDYFYEWSQDAPAAPDGSRTQYVALIQTFVKDEPQAQIVNRMPTAWEMYLWAMQIVNAKKDKLAGMQWYVFRFGDLYSSTLGNSRFDGEGGDRWQVIADVAAVLKMEQPFLS